MKFSIKKIIGLILLIIFVAVIVHYGIYYAKITRVGAGYKAKILCSAVFISNRPAESVLNEEFSHPLLKYFQTDIDYEKRTVSSHILFGLIKRKATFTDAYGAILDFEKSDLDTSIIVGSKRSVVNSNDLWPAGSSVELNNLPMAIDQVKLNQAVSEAFIEPDSTKMLRTRAVVVVYNGRIIAERYAAPITAATPLLGWSMSKSVTSALIGILIRQGRLKINLPVPAPEWQHPDDPRRDITFHQMLRMTSGLQFEESYKNPLSDVTVMLFGEKDAAAFSASHQLIHEPGTKWYYSSGTTNIISRSLREIIGGNFADYLRFPYQELFNKLGMTSAMFETDGAGTFVGSSFLYATARDWARFGLLYLQDGIWNGTRILPDGWVDYSRSRTDISRDQRYGAHFWLPATKQLKKENYVPIPSDLFYLSGHYGQRVSIIPSAKLVVVRLGQTDNSDAWNQYKFLGKILEAINYSTTERS